MTTTLLSDSNLKMKNEINIHREGGEEPSIITSQKILLYNRIELFEIDKKEQEVQEQEPFILVELNGNGCGLERCNCSPSNYISISNGEIGLVLALTDEEADKIKKTGKLDIVQLH